MSINIKNFLVEYEKSPVGVTTTHPRFSWQIESDEKSVKQEGYRITVTEWIATPVWDSGFVESDENINILYKGIVLSRDTQYYATLTVKINGKEYTETTTFRSGLLGHRPPHIGWIRPDTEESEYKFSPYFRREFALKSDEIAYATAYITARGWYELYLNGEKIDKDAVMAPAWNTQYSKSYLQAYDITENLKTGKNAIGVLLGNGYSKNYRHGLSYHNGKRLWAFFSIVYTDGSYQHIWTDESWKWHTSPIIFDHIYDGEWYDAKKELPGWNKQGFNDAGWQSAMRSTHHEVIEEVFTPPVRVLGTRPCVKKTEIGEKTYIYDFKYNGSGVLKIKVKGDPNAEIHMQHAENVFPDGTLQPWTNRNAEATDRYILKGDGEETYTPTFTYHCFRYVEFTIIGNAEILDAEALVYGTDMFNDSCFKCSNDMINRIEQNFVRTLKTNFMSWPTDTGVRDERTPCSMDILVYEEMAMHHCDIHNYFEKWLKKGISEGGNPDWSGDSIVLVWMMLKYYGDKVLAKESYSDLLSLIWAFYYRYQYNQFIKAFGDWSAPNPTNEYEDSFSSVQETNIAMWYREMQMFLDIADALGETDDAAQVKEFMKLAKHDYIEMFYDEKTHLFSNGKQTPNLLAIANGIVTGKEKDLVLEALIKSIKEKDDSHLDTGIFGTRKLIEVLSETESGRDLVYDILNQTTYPSFGQQILGRDATTAWEQWYNLQGMMTCSHSMFLGIGADFFKKFAGIESLENAYKKILIKPVATSKISFVDCKLETVRGTVEVHWKRLENGDLSLTATIPANSTATVIMPNGKTTEIASGTYTF